MLRASRDEIREGLDFFSLPLGWFSSGFVIHSQQRFADVCGVIFANAFFYAIPIFLLYHFGRFIIRRNRVTRMDLAAGSTSSEEDDE